MQSNRLNTLINRLLSIQGWVVTFFQVVQSGWSLFCSRSKVGGRIFPMISENRMTRPSPGINYDQALSLLKIFILVFRRLIISLPNTNKKSSEDYHESL